MTDTKSGLIDSLRIDRGAAVKKRSRGSGWMLAVTVATVLLLAAGGAWYFWPDSRIPVHVVTVSAGGGASTGSDLDASGYVVARRQATLTAKIQGKVLEVNFEEGQKVKAGDLIAKLDDSDYEAALLAAQALAVQAKAALDDAAPTYARYENLNKQGAISTDAVQTQRTLYDNARTQYGVAQAQVAIAQAALRDTLVRAPFDGIVIAKVAQVGEVVAPQASGGGSTRTGIVTIVDMGSLEVQVDVSENYIERVKVGGTATIHLDAYPDWDIPGSVIAIIPTADQSKGTVAVRVQIKTKDSRILPEMAARVSFMTAPERNSSLVVARITVPPAAVIVNGKTGTVFVLKDDGVVEKRDVAVGLKTAQAVTILSGITTGDRLAGDSLDKLHDGDKVRIVD